MAILKKPDKSLILLLITGAAAGLLPCLFKPLLALALWLGLILALIILLYPRLGFILAVASIPLEVAGRLQPIMGAVPLTIAKIFTALTLVAWLVHLALRRVQFRHRPWMYLLVGFWTVAALSLIGAKELKYGLEALLSLTTTVAFFFLVVQLVDTPRMLKLALAAFLVASTVTVPYAVIQRFLPGSTLEFRLSWEDKGAVTYGVEKDIVERHLVGVVGRSSGLFTHYNELGLNICLLFAPILAFWRNTPREDFWRRLFWIFAFFLLIPSLVSTFSRTAFILMFFILFMMCYRGFFRITPIKLALAALAGIIFLSLAPQQYINRLFKLEMYTTQGQSVSIRNEVAKAALRQALDHPLLGVGYGNHYGIFDYYTTWPLKKIWITPHNAYLQVAAHTGFLGLAALLLFFWKVHRYTRRSVETFREQGRTDLVNLGNALNISLLSNLIGGLTLDMFARGMAYFWLIVGLCAAYAILGQEYAAIPGEVQCQQGQEPGGILIPAMGRPV